MGLYKLRVPHIQSGSMLIQGHNYEVRDWIVEVDNLHTANFMVEHSACTILGVEATKKAKNIIVKRGQGLGDVLMMTPILRKIKQINPEAKITFACFEIFLDVCKHLPYIDRIVTTGQLGYHNDDCWVNRSDGGRDEYDYWVNCDGIAEHKENNAKISSMHRVDIFGELAGLTFTEAERRLDYVVTQEEADWAKAKWAQLGLRDTDKVMAMAVRTTCWNRNWPPEKFRRMAQLAHEGGWRIMLFDHDGAFGWEGPGVVNMTGKTKIREMAALMARCDMFFGPDTGAWHLACALNVPNVVYFGAIDWKLRVTMPRTRVVVRKAACYPCNRYDCHWHNKLECIDISPESCWEEILRLDSELARPNKQVSTEVRVNEEKSKVEIIKAGDVAATEFINTATGRPLSVH